MRHILHYYGLLSGFDRNAKLFLASTFINGLGISLLVLLYNLYILSLGFHQDMIGLVTLVACLAAVVASLPMAWVANQIGHRRALIIGIVGSGLSIALPLVVPTGGALIAGEVVWGIAFTLMIVVSAPFMSDNSSKEQRPYLFSVQFVLLTLAGFVGSLFGGDLPRLAGALFNAKAESPEAYQGALGVAVALMLASAIPLFFLARSAGSHPRAARPRFVVTDGSKMIRLLLPWLLGAAGGGMFVPFVNVFWKLSHHLDDVAIGQIFALSALFMTGLILFAPALSRRWGMVRVMVVTQLLSTAGLLLFGFSSWFIVAVVGYLGRDALMNLSRPLFGQFQMEQSALDERAAVSSLSTMVYNLAWGIGSWISGVWQSQGQFGTVFLLSAVLFLASAVSLHWSFGRQQAPEAKFEPATGTSAIPVGSMAE